MEVKQLQFFSSLKLLVLHKYQERFPHVELDWKSFSSRDIEQLIDDVYQKTNERVSEKWIYTHLKPAVSEKLPRKDMLHIFSKYCGFKSWEEFCLEQITSQPILQKKRRYLWMVFVGVLLVGIFFFCKIHFSEKKNVKNVLKIVDGSTKEILNDTTISIFVETENDKKVLNSELLKGISKNDQLSIESPFYKDPVVEEVGEESMIVVTPIDYALVIKGYLKADIQDWNLRREKLNLILSDNLEVMLYLPNQLGIEYMNKEEFSQKLIVPNSKIRSWEIVSITQDEDNKISKIRLKQ